MLRVQTQVNGTAVLIHIQLERGLVAPFGYGISLNPPFSLGTARIHGGCAIGRPSKSSIFATSVQYGLALGVKRGATLSGNEYLRYFCLLIQWYCTERHMSMVTSTMHDSNVIHGDLVTRS